VTLYFFEPWTWEEMACDIWNTMSDLLGDFPGLPVTPDGLPEDWKFPGGGAWAALNQVLYKCGCMIAVDLRQPAGSQYTIVQIGATDATFEQAMAALDKQNFKVFDEEWLESDIGRLPGGCQVFFHRKQWDYGTEETAAQSADQFSTQAVYSVQVDGPNTGTTIAGLYHPLWDDLPALYDATGNLLNGAALTLRANNRTNDFYRMTGGVGGSRLRKHYGAIIGFTPGSECKGVCWRQWTEKDGGWITDIVRHPWKFLRGLDEHGEWMAEDMGSLAIQPPAFEPSYPNYPRDWQRVYVGDALAAFSMATEATIEAGGTDYEVGDMLYLASGSFTSAFQAVVSGVSSGGVVTSVELIAGGNYTSTPSNPASTNTNGAGSGCTLTITWQQVAGFYNGFVQRYDPWADADADREPTIVAAHNSSGILAPGRVRPGKLNGFVGGLPFYLAGDTQGAWFTVSGVSASNPSYYDAQLVQFVPGNPPSFNPVANVNVWLVAPMDLPLTPSPGGSAPANYYAALMLGETDSAEPAGGGTEQTRPVYGAIGGWLILAGCVGGQIKNVTY
jgi:hypothetical protein